MKELYTIDELLEKLDSYGDDIGSYTYNEIKRFIEDL